MAVGTAVFLAHLALAIALFLAVHASADGQAGFAWFYFMTLDYPISHFAWEYLATTPPFQALMAWGYTWGSGPNLRALFIHGLVGGAQWFALASVLAFFLWPRHGYVALRKTREL
jgi:uncharacterized protein YndB with AHSA1/START domain